MSNTIYILQSVIDLIFKGNLVYLSPLLFLFMVALFADRLIDLIYYALSEGRRR